MCETNVNDSLLNGLKEIPKIQEMENIKVKKKSKRTQWKQWAACISATLSMVAAGTVYGWTTTVLPSLSSNTTEAPIHITMDESSWVISVTVIGSMIGPFYGAYIAASYGRKLCLLMSSLFYILGWLLVIFVQSVWYLYFSRVILGIGIGMSYTTNPMYVSEVADVNIRGALSTLIAVNVFTGSLLACSVGPFTSYLVLGIVLLSIPILFVLTFAWFPETPYYLVSKGRNAEAMKVLAFFKGIDDEEELRQELELVRKNAGDDELKFNFSDIFLLTKVRNFRAMMIIMGLIMGQQLSGNFSTMQYLEYMFKVAHIGIQPHIATIIVLAVGLISGALSTMTVESAGRRPLLIYSTFGCTVTLGILGVYLKLDPEITHVSWINLIPVLDVIIFQVAYQIGLGTMPNLLIGELFPTNVKGIAGAVATIFDGLMGFIVSKMYEVISSGVGTHAIYFVFSVSCAGLFIFVYGFVPETKKKTFQEIQDILGDHKPFNMPSDQLCCSCCTRQRRKTKVEEA